MTVLNSDSNYVLEISEKVKNLEGLWLDILSKQFQKNIKPIIMAVTFSSSTNDSLSKAISFIKSAFIRRVSINSYSKKKYSYRVYFC